MWNVFNTGEEKLKEAIANYYTLISMIDDQIGRIIHQLEKTGQLENTIIVFIADHGEFFEVTTFCLLINCPISTFSVVFIYNEMKSLDVISLEYRGNMFNMAS